MLDAHVLLDILKILAPIAVSYLALLRTRTDLDRYIAAQRARERGNAPLEAYLRRRWYHRFYRVRKPK